MYHANILNFLSKILKRDLIEYDFAVSLPEREAALTFGSGVAIKHTASGG
jgi:hypothetical protein